LDDIEGVGAVFVVELGCNVGVRVVEGIIEGDEPPDQAFDPVSFMVQLKAGTAESGLCGIEQRYSTRIPVSLSKYKSPFGKCLPKSAIVT
jgi:hypothetical protein